jgi:pyruvate dehydrogenase E2 component (dihydrolipoamide acetyltransferase)
MATAVIMPRQGQSVESCIIVSWKKRKGDPVKAGEVLCEVETDKATFEVESPSAGTLLAIFAEQGADVPVLTPIAAVGAPGESVDTLRAGATAPPSPEQAAEARVAAPAGPPAVTLPPSSAGGKTRASPRARALAASKGVDLAGLKGTGPGGRIIERDVAAVAMDGEVGRAMDGGRPTRAPARPAPPVAAAPAGLPAAGSVMKEVRLTGIRKIISDRMLASLQTTAQLTMHSAADARTLQTLRRRFKESPEGMGLREVTINDMVLFAVARTLTQFPDLNALASGDTIQLYSAVHLGVAVDTTRGLMVPVIRDAHTLGLRDVSREAKRLIAACREGGIRAEEMADGTFTVTNLGTFGIHGFTPVLHAPQVGILGVGAIVAGPVMEGERVVFVPQISLSLTINHQVVDGAPAARFLHALAADIGRFDLLLAR